MEFAHIKKIKTTHTQMQLQRSCMSFPSANFMHKRRPYIGESGLKFGLDCWETTSHTGAQEEACWKEFRIPRGPTKAVLRRIRISIISCILGPWNTEE